ncbi:hypothetical protein LMH87_011629 [Akanthomyces muscarius]|uniref:Uncharacterized protein n=1 Tax=Akanthomyces muscarius TaxID=2231603 RepID=A0A9W8QB02_AKAMU|nr:hypothetical protein LMH87_011629 [Akanthomyces muscarius]KAJ4150901.1 hypothetical protein LMH87_011629 [Akanthomyces muscarius]
MDQPRRMAALGLQERGAAAQSPEAWGITTEEAWGGTLSPKNNESLSGKGTPVAAKAQQSLTSRSKGPSSTGSGLASSRWAPGGASHGPPSEAPSETPKAPRGGLAKSLWAPGNVPADSHNSEDQIMGGAE